jgi:hypothetical protein
MTLKRLRLSDGWNGRTRQVGQLAISAVDEISAFYTVMAKILIGRFEDFSDIGAARRLRRLNLVAARQQVATVRTTWRRG